MAQFTREDMIRAIYGQESNSGKADTSKENYAGARGPMQVTGSTFDLLKNKGIIPNSYKHANPEHTKAAGEALVGYLFDKYEGDPSKTAAAYYAGEKAVREDGSIRNFKDKKNPNAPDVNRYVADITARLGLAPTAPVEALAAWDQVAPTKAPAGAAKAIALKGAPDMGTPWPQRAEGRSVPLVDQYTAEGVAAQAENQKRADVTSLDIMKAASLQATFAGSWLRDKAMKDFGEEHPPLPGYRVPNEELKDSTTHDQEFLLTASSPQMLERIKMEIRDRDADLETMGAKGMGVALGLGLIAGLPEGGGIGFAASKAFQLAKVGSLAYAAKGQRGAAAASSLAENVGANVALTAAQDAIDPYIGTLDYGMAVAGGVLGGALSLPGIYSVAGKADLMKEATRLGDAAAAEYLAVWDKAVKNLGEGATPEQLHAEVARLEGNKIRETLNDASSPTVPKDRRLIPEDESLREDVPEIKPTEAATSKSDPAEMVEQKFKSESPKNWSTADAAKDEIRKEKMRTTWAKYIAEVEGVNQRWLDKQQTGTHTLPEFAAKVEYAVVAQAVSALVAKHLPNSKVALGISTIVDAVHEGTIFSAGDTHAIALRGDLTPRLALEVAIHEVGHAVFHEHARNIPQPLLERMIAEHRAFLADLRSGNQEAAKLKRLREGYHGGKILLDTEYTASFDEYTAEAFVRHIQKAAREGDMTIPQQAIDLFMKAWEKIKGLYDTARGKGYLPKDEAFGEFFNGTASGSLKSTQVKDAAEFLDPGLVANFSKPGDPQAIISTKTARDHGLTLLPVESTTQQAEAKAIISIWDKATKDGYKVDEKRLSALMETAPFQGAQATANTMLRSNSPVVRMVAAELLESPGGAAGRRSNAAIAKHMNEKAYLGNTLNEVQDAYNVFRSDSGGSVWKDFFNGKQWQQFNRMVAEEIESRRPGAAPVDSPATVRAAADSLEKGYERIRVAQQDAKTIGWGSLPETSKGYMPHKMSPEKFINMTAAQGDILHGSLVDQFININGFDITFSQHLATKYMDRIRVRAHGGFDAPVGMHSPGAADMVQEALEQMGMDRLQVTAMMKKYMAGGAAHTKKRINLDLNQEHALPEGGSFRLMDLFETDHFKLLRGQAQRVSGEVALARHGVMGKPGLKLLRRAMEFGADNERATSRELAAFDQVAAEFLGDPFGTQSKLVDRAMQANSLARLGGMGFTQFGEAINGIWHVGVARSLEAVGSFGRLRKEILALAKGEKVDNPILGSIEHMGGAEFGTAAYKTVFPFDNGSLEYHTYGKDTVNAADRLLRGGAYVQGKLSMWRALHSAQQRGFAEQIVRKAAQYLKDGTASADAALKDMGFDDSLLERLRKDIGAMAQFEGDRLTHFDITKATDKDAANVFIQNIHRGTSQIIQDTFIGERGAWAHSSTMRLMTQFRTFGLTSIEKQWARQVGNVGEARALGMLLGSMSIAAPIYMARTYLASVGRKDQQEYLEKQLSAAQIARASLNYVASSGLAGDFLDATTAVTGVGKVTGGRTGVGSSFVGNVIAPSAGLADDVWRGLQNTKEGTDPHDLIKSLPFSRIPWLVPAINALDHD